MQIFSGEDFDARLDDAEGTADVLAQTAQDTGRGQHAVVDVLMQHVGQLAADQQRLVQLGEVVGDQSRQMLQPEFVEHANDAGRTGPDAVDAGQSSRIDLVVQETAQALVDAFVGRRQVGCALHLQMAEAFFDHLREADAPFDLGRHARRLREQEQGVVGMVRHACQQQTGSASRRPVVGPDEDLAHRAGDVGEERHDMHAVTHLFVDRQLDRRQVGREQDDAVAVADLRQAGGEFSGVVGIEAVGDFGRVLVAKVAGDERDLPFDLIVEL